MNFPLKITIDNVELQLNKIKPRFEQLDYGFIDYLQDLGRLITEYSDSMPESQLKTDVEGISTQIEEGLKLKTGPDYSLSGPGCN